MVLDASAIIAMLLHLRSGSAGDAPLLHKHEGFLLTDVRQALEGTED
jgi:uncharacterized protein with PIN domain